MSAVSSAPTAGKTIPVTINGIAVEAPENATILDAAELAQVRIPTLCRHPDLPPTAACGICVVKVKGMDNMIRACCAPLAAGMDIVTQDPEIVQVRRSVLELILSNHPNECLTCARSGECELQQLSNDFGFNRSNMPKLVADAAKDDSTRTLVLDSRKCVHCGRCVTVCQQMQDVWALCVKHRGIGAVVAPAGDIPLADSPCVRCGQCSAHCPTGAITVYDQTETVWRALMDPAKRCVAQIAPAVRVGVAESFGLPAGALVTGKLYSALRRIGFEAVFDTNFGADVTIMEEAAEFIERFIRGKGALPLITTCCPAWVDFMEKHESDMIEHFSSCKSPQAIVGALAKSYGAEKLGMAPDTVFVASIMPCTAKKYEIRRTREMFSSGRPDIDVAITTRELARMLRQAGIEFDKLPEEEADSPLGRYTGAGTIFGVTGGVMTAALRTAHFLAAGVDLPDDGIEFAPLRTLDGVKTFSLDMAGKEVRVAVAHGLRHVREVIDQARRAKLAGREPPFHFIEVMACAGGCVGGGGQFWGVTDAKRRERAAGLMADDRRCEFRRSHENPDVKRLYDEYIGKPLGEKAHSLFHTTYIARKQYKR